MINEEDISDNKKLPERLLFGTERIGFDYYGPRDIVDNCYNVTRKVGRGDIFKKSITLIQAKHVLPRLEINRLVDGTCIYEMRENLVAAVLDKTDDAIREAIMQAVDSGKIQRAYILDAGSVENVLKKSLPEAPVKREYGSHHYCPSCGEWVYENFHPYFCGACGKALDWNKRKEN